MVPEKVPGKVPEKVPEKTPHSTTQVPLCVLHSRYLEPLEAIWF
jgi:hypothetical protein